MPAQRSTDPDPFDLWCDEMRERGYSLRSLWEAREVGAPTRAAPNVRCFTIYGANGSPLGAVVGRVARGRKGARPMLFLFLLADEPSPDAMTEMLEDLAARRAQEDKR